MKIKLKHASFVDKKFSSFYQWFYCMHFYSYLHIHSKHQRMHFQPYVGNGQQYYIYCPSYTIYVKKHGKNHILIDYSINFNHIYLTILFSEEVSLDID